MLDRASFGTVVKKSIAFIREFVIGNDYRDFFFIIEFCGTTTFIYTVDSD